jgi:hypothetical protein
MIHNKICDLSLLIYAQSTLGSVYEDRAYYISQIRQSGREIY